LKSLREFFKAEAKKSFAAKVFLKEICSWRFNFLLNFLLDFLSYSNQVMKLFQQDDLNIFQVTHSINSIIECIEDTHSFDTSPTIRHSELSRKTSQFEKGNKSS